MTSWKPCQIVFSQRFKCAGMKWGIESGASILTLRVIAMNGLWSNARNAMFNSQTTALPSTPRNSPHALNINAAKNSELDRSHPPKGKREAIRDRPSTRLGTAEKRKACRTSWAERRQRPPRQEGFRRARRSYLVTSASRVPACRGSDYRRARDARPHYSGPTACATAERNDTTAIRRGRVRFDSQLSSRVFTPEA